MPILKTSIFTQIKEWLMVTLGILIYTLAWALFLIPNNLVGGGVSGISSIIQYATHGAIQMGYTPTWTAAPAPRAISRCRIRSHTPYTMSVP